MLHRRDMLSTGMLLATGGALATALPFTAAEAQQLPGLLIRGVEARWVRGAMNGRVVLRVLIDRVRLSPATRALEVFGRLTSTGGNIPVALTDRRFAAVATLGANDDDDDGDTGGDDDEACTIPVLNIGRIQLDNLNLVINPRPIQLEVVTDPSNGQLGVLLCRLAERIREGRPLPQIRQVSDPRQHASQCAHHHRHSRGGWRRWRRSEIGIYW